MASELAAQPDMVRSHQKDENYRETLLDSANELVRRTVGPRNALFYEREVQLGSDLIYYLATIACGRQTLGEEYCDILQVTGRFNLAPSISRRSALALMQACGPYLAEKVSQQNSGANMLMDDENSESLAEEERSILQKGLGWLSYALPWILRSHLALFYLYGTYYQISHRFTGTQYLFLGKIFEKRPHYSLLGVFMILQILLSASNQGLSYLAKNQKEENQSAGGDGVRLDKNGRNMPRKAAIIQNDEGRGISQRERRKNTGQHRCPLCLSPRESPTATPCGHVFCWTCIAAWVNQKPECPLCRAECSGNDLVCVHHADY